MSIRATWAACGGNYISQTNYSCTTVTSYAVQVTIDGQHEENRVCGVFDCDYAVTSTETVQTFEVEILLWT
jgi:hypothetical protein